MGKLGAKRHKPSPSKEEAKPVAITVPHDCLPVDGAPLHCTAQCAAACACPGLSDGNHLTCSMSQCMYALACVSGSAGSILEGGGQILRNASGLPAAWAES